MKRIIILSCLVICVQCLYGQFPFHFRFDTLRVDGWPGLHSFAYGRIQKKLLVIGGRRDGIHNKENGFERIGVNDSIFIIDLENLKTKSWALEFFDPVIFDALTSSNPEFIQKNQYLYWIGGYGESISGAYKTFGTAVEIDLEKLIYNLEHNLPQQDCFRKIEDPYFAITGGQIEIIDNIYCLIGGHRFEGKYNNNSGKINQQYTSKVYYFKLLSQPDSFYVVKLDSLQDDFNFHRRDFNTTVFQMSNGEKQVIINSGVFLMNEDRPYFNIAKLNRANYEDITDMQQKLANYSCAKLGFIDRQENVMRYFFFGGMSEFYRDSTGNIGQDGTVPFVKHISFIRRDANDKFDEFIIDDTLPGYFGTNAEFVYSAFMNLGRDEFLDPNIFSANPIHIGWIFGGLWNTSNDRNAWFKNKANQVVANPYFIKLSLQRTTATQDPKKTSSQLFKLELLNNPVKLNLNFKIHGETPKQLHYWILDSLGKLIEEAKLSSSENAQYSINTNYPSGQYKLIVSINKEFLITTPFLLVD